MSEYVDTIIIGGGQAGLAAGYFLKARGVPFLILDAHQRTGDSWRRRWDSLCLFTVGPYNSLPGMDYPGPSHHYPTKDEIADYLESYAQRFDLPIRHGIKANRVFRDGDSFEISHSDGSISATNVVVAIGSYHQPRIPSFAAELDRAITQLHSTEYRNRAQLREGGVLVVGAGNSGAEIALDVSAHHQVWLSGPDTGHEPTRPGTMPDRLIMPLLWLAATRLTVETRLGRRLRDHFIAPPRGIPLARVRAKDLTAAGVERVGRTTEVSDGYPMLADGRKLEVSNVIWCTGFTPAFGWIDVPLPLHNGYPIQERGVVAPIPGLYFMGLIFQYSLSSALVGGVGRDAAYIADHIASNRLPAMSGAVPTPSE